MMLFTGAKAALETLCMYTRASSFEKTICVCGFAQLFKANYCWAAAFNELIESKVFLHTPLTYDTAFLSLLFRFETF